MSTTPEPLAVASVPFTVTETADGARYRLATRQELDDRDEETRRRHRLADLLLFIFGFLDPMCLMVGLYRLFVRWRTSKADEILVRQGWVGFRRSLWPFRWTRWRPLSRLRRLVIREEADDPWEGDWLPTAPYELVAVCQGRSPLRLPSYGPLLGLAQDLALRCARARGEGAPLDVVEEERCAWEERHGEPVGSCSTAPTSGVDG
jgi:hypothetical protein